MNNSLTIYEWKDIKKRIELVNQPLVEKFDELNGVNNYKVIISKYKFGQDIIKKGLFHLNLDGINLPYSSDTIKKEVKNLLQYHWRTIPFGMVLNNSIESHVNHSTHIIPFMLLPPGQTFALLSMFDPHTYSNLIPGLYSTKAGCRSLILLNKLTHTESNNRLSKKFKIGKHVSPKTLADQWFLLKELADSSEFKTDWNAEVIFFTKDFVNNIHKNRTVAYELLYNVWEALSFRRNEVTHDFIWSIFLQELPLSLKHDSLIIESVKHIILLAMREVPGYIPACTNQAGPLLEFLDALLHIYKIRFNYPVFMQLDNYNNKDPIYYSLHRPTFFHELPDKSTSRQTINELIKIKRVFLLYKDYILNNKFEHSLERTLLYKTLVDTEFEFYHPKGDDGINTDILSMINEDKRFIQSPYSQDFKDDLSFPEHSIFFNGCIRIRPIKRNKRDKEIE